MAAVDVTLLYEAPDEQPHPPTVRSRTRIGLAAGITMLTVAFIAICLFAGRQLPQSNATSQMPSTGQASVSPKLDELRDEVRKRADISNVEQLNTESERPLFSVSKIGAESCGNRSQVTFGPACTRAAKKLGYVWKGEIDDASVPKDCYVSVGGGAHSGKDVWYNVHPLGVAHDHTKLICADYTLSEIGSEDCPAGSTPELRDSHCDIAASLFDYVWKGKIDHADVPKGCYVSVGGGSQSGKDLWFNTHEHGNSHPHTRRVCVVTR